MKNITSLLFLTLLAFVTSCDRDPYNVDEPSAAGEAPDMPDMVTAISPWNGQMATDADADTPGNDIDIYHEANTFTGSVNVTFSEDKVNVESSNTKLSTHIEGAHLVLDLTTPGADNTVVNVTGSTSDGSLKIYSQKSVKLVLNGVKIKSELGPAINCQVKKRLFVDLPKGTRNELYDAEEYSADIFSLPTSTGKPEDRKGCFFSEADMIFSGTGLLRISGLNTNAIAVDGYMAMRPGVTLVVDNARKHAISVKGQSSTGRGIDIRGGYIYANTSGDAGKALRSELKIAISGNPTMELNTSGCAIFDTEDNDTSSGSCIKSLTSLSITGGNFTLRATGDGGKGINVTQDVNISGGRFAISTTGEKYQYSDILSSSPKALNVGGILNISSAEMVILVKNTNSSTDGIEAIGRINILNHADVKVYASGDAVNAKSSLQVNDANLSATSINSSGIDCKADLYVDNSTISSVGGPGKYSLKVLGDEFFVTGISKMIIFGGMAIQTNAPLPDGNTFMNVTGMAKGTVVNIAGEEITLPCSYSNPRTAELAIIKSI